MAVVAVSNRIFLAAGCRWASTLTPRASISVGDSDEETRTFSSEEVAQFAALSGDCNPIHLDTDYAKQTRFGKPIVHGVLINGFLDFVYVCLSVDRVLSAVMGTRTPGIGTIFMSQTQTFKVTVCECV